MIWYVYDNVYDNVGRSTRGSLFYDYCVYEYCTYVVYYTRYFLLESNQLNFNLNNGDWRTYKPAAIIFCYFDMNKPDKNNYRMQTIVFLETVILNRLFNYTNNWSTHWLSPGIVFRNSWYIDFKLISTMRFYQSSVSVSHPNFLIRI